MIIKTIKINQFKGQKSLKLDNLSDVVTISGDNDTGKTTIANAIIWCLFGKDIEDRSNFEIMPIDESNKVIPHMEPSVFIMFDIDGRDKTFKRVMKQKWVKKRGEESSQFDGSTITEYFVDDVPVKQKDFNDHVIDICNESVFRCLTLPTYFPLLHWEKRRDIITSIVGDVDEEAIRKDFTDLFDKMNGKSIEDFRKVIALEKKGYKEEKVKIPEGIKASEAFITENYNWAEIESSIKKKKAEIELIDSKISDKSKVLSDYNKQLESNAEKIRILSKEKVDFVSQWTHASSKKRNSILSEIQNVEQKKFDATNEIQKLNNEMQLANNSINSSQERIDLLIANRASNKDLWGRENGKGYIEPKDSICQSCGQEIALNDVEIIELKEKFNEEKAKTLEAIISNNTPLLNECESLEKKIIEWNNDIDNLSVRDDEYQQIKEESIKESEKLNKELNSIDVGSIEAEAKKHPDHVAKDAEIEKLQNSDMPSVDVSEFTEKKTDIQSEIYELKTRLDSKFIIDKAKLKINEYSARDKELAIKIVELEGLEYQTEMYEKALIDQLEIKVNNLFTGLQFKMFEKQINGGIKPTCVILINGVPYESANTAARIQSGIEIINVLADYYEINCPILIDNRESVIEIPKTKSQVFNMMVTKGEKLTIKS